MTGSYLLQGKSDPFDGLSEATPTELPERRHEEGARGGMKRLMEEAAARHSETVHYSASAGIRVEGSES